MNAPSSGGTWERLAGRGPIEQLLVRRRLASHAADTASRIRPREPRHSVVPRTTRNTWDRSRARLSIRCELRFVPQLAGFSSFHPDHHSPTNSFTSNEGLEPHPSIIRSPGRHSASTMRSENVGYELTEIELHWTFYGCWRDLSGSSPRIYCGFGSPRSNGCCRIASSGRADLLFLGNAPRS